MHDIKAISEKWNIDPQVLNVLLNSIYPKETLDTIKVFIDYCQKSLGLTDGQLLRQLAHIRKQEERVGVLPGIGYYRLRAIESGCYAGISEPEFGPVLTFKGKAYNSEAKKYVEQEVLYPEWCKIVVKKIVQGEVCEFIAKEYWLENYAFLKSGFPNYMWTKRPYGQLSKCAEAQALRKAFDLDQRPSFEEMDGKVLYEDEEELDILDQVETSEASKPQTIEEKVGKIVAQQGSTGQENIIPINSSVRLKELIARNNVGEDKIAKALAKVKAKNIDDMKEADILTWINHLENPPKAS